MARQTVRDIAVVVVDDGSQDETPTLVACAAERDGRIALVRGRGEGIAGALNRGLPRCDAEVVARMDADDLAQEAFVKAYRMLGGFKGESSFYTWFMKVLSNLCLDHLRKEAVIRRVFFFQTPREDDEDGWDQMEQIPDPKRAGMPDAGMEQKELRAALNKALRALPGRQRAVFLLKHDEGMKLSEVAAVLGISEGAVKAHMVRAVAALRKGMKDYGSKRHG